MMHVFDGEITLWTDSKNLPGPFVLPLRFSARFDPPGEWRVAPADFGDQGEEVIDDVDIGAGSPATLRISLANTAMGRRDPDSGESGLQTRLQFRLAPFRSALTLPFDTSCHRLQPGSEEQCGQPWTDGAQALRLVARGVFAGGPLNGTACLAALAGSFQPPVPTA